MYPSESRSYESLYRFAANEMTDWHIIRGGPVLGHQAVRREIERFSLRSPPRVTQPIRVAEGEV